MNGRTRFLTGMARGALCTATRIALRPAREHEFIEFDDRAYMTANYQVRQRRTRETVLCSVRTNHTGNCPSLTWLSVNLFARCNQPFDLSP